MPADDALFQDILSLMEKFDIACPTDARGSTYIVPHLLPHDPPVAFGANAAGSERRQIRSVVVQLSFLPVGLAGRLICNLMRACGSGDYEHWEVLERSRWRSGAEVFDTTNQAWLPAFLYFSFSL